MSARDRRWLSRAVTLASGNVEAGGGPFGALIVADEEILGTGVNRVTRENDPTAHAEMQAIRDAARRLGTGDLTSCAMYGTSRACPMCEAGAYWAHITRMYYGVGIIDAGAPRLP